MAIEIVSTVFTPYLLPAETGNFLLGNINERVKIETTFDVVTYALGTTDNDVIFYPTLAEGYVSPDHIISVDPIFTDFYVGDSIKIYLSNVFYKDATITSKISDYDIIVNVSGGHAGKSVSNDCQIYNMTAITALRYYWGIIENSESNNYISKVDGSEQQAIIESKLASDTSSSDMIMQGSECYQIGSVTVVGVSIGGTPPFAQRYKITHDTFITPFFLESQYYDISNKIAPNYLLNGNSLKYAFKIVALPQFTDPNIKKEIEVSEQLGNVGWYDENYNNNPSNYSLYAPPVYKNAANVVIPSLQLTTDVQTVIIGIQNFTDSPFSSTDTPFVLGFFRTLDDEADYIGNGRTMDVNFMFDWCQAIEGINTGNTGSNYATDRQVITAISSFDITGDVIQITATIQFGADIIAEYSAANRQSYVLYVTTADYTDTVNSDRVNILVDSNVLYINNSDPGLVDFDSVFYRHYEDEGSAGVVKINAYPQDEIVAYTQVRVDRTNSPVGTDTVSIQNMHCKIIARNISTNAEFTLDEYNQSFVGLTEINDQQFIDNAIPRPYFIPSNEIRKNIVFKSRQDEQTGNYYYFDVFFPFMMRWEYWQLLAGVDNVFYDPAEDMDGFNDFWHRYSTFTDWQIFYELDMNVNKNGSILNYKETKRIYSNDWDSNTAWQPGKIRVYEKIALTSGLLTVGKTYLIDSVVSGDDFTNVGFATAKVPFVATGTTPTNWSHSSNVFKQLYDSSLLKHFILGYEDVLVVAEFEHNRAVFLGENTIRIGLQVFEEGGIDTNFGLSSQWARPNGILKSINTSDLVLLDIANTHTMRGRCLLDYSQLTNKSKWILSARIYNYPKGADVKLTEGGLPKSTEDNFLKIIE